MPEQEPEQVVFNQHDNPEMQTLKNLIYNSNLHNQVKSYIANNTIKFYAFESTEELIKRYGGVLQFHLTIKQNIVNIVFMGWKDFHQYTKAIQCDISYSELGQQPIQTINDKLSKLIRQLRSQHWYPSDCKDAFGKRQQGGITPPVCVSETAAAANADENEDERVGDSAKQSDDDFLSFAEGVLKEIGYKSPADGFWKDQTLNLNPWCNFVMKGKTLFVLEGDRSGIEDYNKEQKNKDTYIHLDAPPQPYIGNPTAPIWLLLMNPSYSPVDEAEITGRIPENLKELINKKGLKYINFIERSSPQERRRFMEAQLPFKQQSSFYPLEEDFNVWDHDGGSPQGSYRWWQKMLLEKNICNHSRPTLNGFFVLESFPYHSRNFDEIIPWKLSRSHCLFWVMMVAYALANKKILLCRGKDIAERVAAIAEKICRHCANEAKQEQIFVCANPQNFFVSTEKFIAYEVMEKIDDLKSKAKAEFACKIVKKLNEWKLQHDSAGA